MALDLNPRQRRMLKAILRSPLWLPQHRAHVVAEQSNTAMEAAQTSTASAVSARASAQVSAQAPHAAPAFSPAHASSARAAPAPVAAPASSPSSAPLRTPAYAPAQPLQLLPRPAGIEHMDWPALQSAVASCQACGLCQKRTQTVFGVGDQQADWLVVGEAPGENEDLQGEPFVGQAGKLLDAMLAAMRDLDGQPLSRTRQVYIANVLKCRPPGNRNPEPAEVAQCEPFLKRQVELLQPKIILAMGRFAVQSLLQSSEPIGKLRGRLHSYAGVPVVVTYHPAYLLRNLPDKAKAWADLCLAMHTVQNAAQPAASTAATAGPL
jgi:uracil-DNA glycosylase